MQHPSLLVPAQNRLPSLLVFENEAQSKAHLQEKKEKLLNSRHQVNQKTKTATLSTTENTWQKTAKGAWPVALLVTAACMDPPSVSETQLTFFLQISNISHSALRTVCPWQVIKYGNDQATHSGFRGLCSAWESVKSLVVGSLWFPASSKDIGEGFASHLDWKCIRGSVKSLLTRT